MSVPTTREFIATEELELLEMKKIKPFRDWFAATMPDGSCVFWSAYNKRRANKLAAEGCRVIAYLLPRKGTNSGKRIDRNGHTTE